MKKTSEILQLIINRIDMMRCTGVTIGDALTYLLRKSKISLQEYVDVLNIITPELPNMLDVGAHFPTDDWKARIEFLIKLKEKYEKAGD